MSTTETETRTLQAYEAQSDRKRSFFASGGVIGAILASSCCIVPLLFVMLGVSGAWIGSLTALEPYKPVFAGIALVFIGLGFRQVISRRVLHAMTTVTVPSRNRPSSPRSRSGFRRSWSCSR